MVDHELTVDSIFYNNNNMNNDINNDINNNIYNIPTENSKRYDPSVYKTQENPVPSKHMTTPNFSSHPVISSRSQCDGCGGGGGGMPSKRRRLDSTASDTSTMSITGCLQTMDLDMSPILSQGMISNMSQLSYYEGMSLTPTRDETIIDDNDEQSGEEEEEEEEEFGGEEEEEQEVAVESHPESEPEIENIFEDDVRDHLEDILDTMLEKEYTEYQDGLRVTSAQLPQRYLNCRDVVIDWLSEVAEEYDWFGKDSLACAVVYMDRYISLAPMLHRNKYQLLGSACLLIAGM